MMETEVAGLSLDQVLLVPSESNVLPNAVSLATNLSADVQEALPVIGAPAMTDLGMAQAFAENGALAVLPAGERNYKMCKQWSLMMRLPLLGSKS